MRVKKGIGYLLLGAVAYLGFLVATLPAEQLLGALRGQLKGVYLQNVGGTVWRGRIGQLQVADQRFEQVRWTTRPLSLLTGALAFDVAFDGVGRQGSGRIALGADGSLALEAFSGRVAMMDIDHLLGIAPARLGGLLEFDLVRLELMGRHPRHAEGTVRWREAAVTVPVAMMLGDFRLDLTTEGGVIKGVVKDEGGAIALDGVVTLQADGRYTFNGQIAARDSSNKMLAQGIRALGRPGPDGRVAVSYSGRLP